MWFNIYPTLNVQLRLTTLFFVEKTFKLSSIIPPKSSLLPCHALAVVAATCRCQQQTILSCTMTPGLAWYWKEIFFSLFLVTNLIFILTNTQTNWKTNRQNANKFQTIFFVLYCLQPKSNSQRLNATSLLHIFICFLFFADKRKPQESFGCCCNCPNKFWTTSSSALPF